MAEKPKDAAPTRFRPHDTRRNDMGVDLYTSNEIFRAELRTLMNRVHSSVDVDRILVAALHDWHSKVDDLRELDRLKYLDQCNAAWAATGDKDEIPF